MASRINTVFGLSVREEDDGASILMGKTILKSHATPGSRKADHQDGYFGWREDDSEMVLPLFGKKPLEEFRKAFSLRRKNEPGLSLIVPWVREKIREVKGEDLISEVARDYFYPILAGQLIVFVEADGKEVTLNAENIGENVPDVEVGRLIRLAQWMKSMPDGQRHEVRPNPSFEPTWSPDMFGESLDGLCESFRNGQKIALRVHVAITPKGGKGAYSTRRASSYFDIALVKEEDETGTGAPCFIRGGIIIPRVRSSRTAKNITALVVAEHGPSAEFLRLCESPLHTDWHAFRADGEYENAAELVDFVGESVSHITRMLSRMDNQRSRDILADIFPMPKERGKHKTPPLRDSICRIEKIDGGFSVCGEAGREVKPGTTLAISVAYNVRRGNPLRKYNRNDFLLENLHMDKSGVESVECNGNLIRAKVTDSDFRVSLSGFDKNRDLYVSANVG